MFILTPICDDQGMNKKKAIICCLQLLIKNYKNKNNLLNANKELYKISMKSRLQYYELIVKLGNITVITELWNVGEIDLNTFIRDEDCKAVQIWFSVILKGQCM